jgi:hypothetical protein
LNPCHVILHSMFCILHSRMPVIKLLIKYWVIYQLIRDNPNDIGCIAWKESAQTARVQGSSPCYSFSAESKIDAHRKFGAPDIFAAPSAPAWGALFCPRRSVWITILFINASSGSQPRSARSRSTPATGPGTRSHGTGRRPTPAPAEISE